MRPGVLAKPRPQVRVQLHTVEHIADFVRSAPAVQILDAPVPPMLEQLPDVMRFSDTFTPDPEQVIEVPMRTAVRDTQLAEAELAGGATPQKSVGILVMDVPVLLSDKFLQSKEFDQNAPQIQFIFRVWDILVCCAEDQWFHGTGAVPGRRCPHAHRCATTGDGVQSVQAALELHSCSVLAVVAAAVEEEGGVQLLPDQGQELIKIISSETGVACCQFILR